MPEKLIKLKTYHGIRSKISLNECFSTYLKRKKKLFNNEYKTAVNKNDIH